MHKLINAMESRSVTNGPHFSRRMLQSLKKELKGWESMFERKHSRKPSKVGKFRSGG